MWSQPVSSSPFAGETVKNGQRSLERSFRPGGWGVIDKALAVIMDVLPMDLQI